MICNIPFLPCLSLENFGGAVGLLFKAFLEAVSRMC